MGGLAGHLMHVHEDWDLTFGDIKQIIRLAGSGKLENCCEKVDGVNLFVTWDARTGQVKAARGKGDIAAGGLSHDDLVQKYAKQPMAAQTFSHGFQAISRALLSVPFDVLTCAFDHMGDVWYSVEILWEGNPNVIRYDGNRLIFHRDSSGRRSSDGQRLNGAVSPNFDALGVAIHHMQPPLGWQVQGTTMHDAFDVHPGDVSHTLHEIDRVMSQVVGTTDTTTLDKFIEGKVRQYIKVPWLPAGTRHWFVRRLMQDKRAPTISQLTKGFAKDQASTLRAINSTSDAILASITEELAAIMSDYSACVLQPARSSLVSDPDAEASRIREAVIRAYCELTESGEPANVALAHRNMARIGNLDSVVAIEGIVFTYKGKTYKFTGTFAAVNQILGALRYRKPGVSEVVRQAITMG